MGEHSSEREHFFNAVKLMAVVTSISRVFGMVRDMAIVSLGGQRATAAFVMAFQIPNLFRRLFGEGALSGSFVPVFTDTAENDGPEAARRLFANALGLLSSLLTGLLVVSWILLLVVRWFSPGAWDRQLLLTLTAITMPFMVTICLLGLGSAVLNCRGHFAWPAVAPIVLNLFMISAAWIVGPLVTDDETVRLIILAASVPTAGVAQLVITGVLLRRWNLPLRPKLTPVEPGVRPMARLMLPMVVGLGFLQISPLLDMFVIWIFSVTDHAPTITLFGHEIAKPLATAAQVRVYAAQRLYQLPLGMLAISLGVAIFPLLSRYAARDDGLGLRETINRALRLSIFEGLAAGTGLFVLARPITHLIFVRGDFQPADAAASAQILQTYAVGMWAYCSYQIVSRSFFALKRPRTPLISSCVLVVVNLLMVISLIWLPSIRAAAFGVATATTASANVLILGWLLRRRIGPIGGRRILRSIVRSIIASALMAGAIGLLRWQLEQTGVAIWIIVAVCVPVGAGVFFASAWLLRCEELHELGRRPASDEEPPAEKPV